MSNIANSSDTTTLQIDEMSSFSILENENYLLVGNSNQKMDIHVAQGKIAEIVDSTINCSLQLHLAPGANVKIISLKHKASNSRYEVFINGAGVDFDLNCISIATGDDNINIYCTVHHTEANSQSKQYIKCIGGDSSKTLFEGKIHILEGAGGTYAYQQNKNLMLTNDATILARPWLEIYADDVKCSHGSTTGMLSEDEIFYMRQRGISLKVAQKLQIEGFALEVAQGVSDPILRESICDTVFEIIENL